MTLDTKAVRALADKMDDCMHALMETRSGHLAHLVVKAQIVLRECAEQLVEVTAQRDEFIEVLSTSTCPTAKQWAEISAIAIACKLEIARARKGTT